MKKYIFIDIDGTLTNSKQQVSLNNINAIKKIIQKDVEIVFCSGRWNGYLVDLSKKCNCSRYLISSNGSMIYDQKEQKIIYQNQISFSILEEIFNYCCNNNIAIAFNSEEYRYCNDYISYNDYYKESNAKKIKNIEEVRDKNISQVCIGSYDYEKMMDIKNYIEKVSKLEIANLSTTIKLKMLDSPNGFFFDVTLRGINKGTGIENFIKIMSIDKNDCIAIGDHINDLKMFDVVGYKIAMSNGCDELKEKANFITKSNDEDGVKYALEYIEKEIL